MKIAPFVFFAFFGMMAVLGAAEISRQETKPECGCETGNACQSCHDTGIVVCKGTLKSGCVSGWRKDMLTEPCSICRGDWIKACAACRRSAGPVTQCLLCKGAGLVRCPDNLKTCLNGFLIKDRTQACPTCLGWGMRVCDCVRKK